MKYEISYYNFIIYFFRNNKPSRLKLMHSIIGQAYTTVEVDVGMQQTNCVWHIPIHDKSCDPFVTSKPTAMFSVQTPKQIVNVCL